MSSTSQPHQPDPSYPSSKPPRPPIPSPTSYLSYPVAHVVSGIYRRLTEPSVPTISTNPPPQASPNTMPGIYTPPNRTASPFQPPPLTPLTLRGIHESTTSSAQILTRALAEEIRLLVPPRLQLVDDWSLIYSVEQDGVSLATLYAKCDVHRGKRSGYVLVVRDGARGIFGAYLSDPPTHPPTTTAPANASSGARPCSPRRCRSPRPQHRHHAPAPQHHARRPHHFHPHPLHADLLLSPDSASSTTPNNSHSAGTSTPDRIRFKAFPYSGVNDYVLYCEPSYLSVGGGDGRYGLWLDGVLERGVSGPCLTFGNEGLSEEGGKFEVLGVEIWCIGV
ncbi:MAG: hypothetical protein FRX48_04590 [Lasallia pustulata]|uniref:Oxidation resistance protein 1 n=1 Tax=Lasallia pustulata TaxID=136370 RepID=A0A5M8PP92_9LECA|nr:MAG: hypothetical protein FRX48_04590 [Lasallia pustulata]